MCIYKSTQVRPYVYMCIHKNTKEFYIGFREKNVKLGVPSDIDFPRYKTSSKIVNPKFNEFNWLILAEFSSGEDAYDFEQQLISENWGNPLLLNKSCHVNSKIRFKNTEESAKKNSESHKGRPATKGMSGQKHSEETKRKMREKRANQVITEETKKKLSLIVTKAHNDPSYVNPMSDPEILVRHQKACILRSSKKKTCPHCGALFSFNSYARWHGDNCKQKSE